MSSKLWDAAFRLIMKIPLWVPIPCERAIFRLFAQHCPRGPQGWRESHGIE